MKKIPKRYFDELINYGHCVPRYESTGEVITNFSVGKEYLIGNDKTNEKVKVRCTQNCPHHLILIK